MNRTELRTEGKQSRTVAAYHRLTCLGAELVNLQTKSASQPGVQLFVAGKQIDRENVQVRDYVEHTSNQVYYNSNWPFMHFTIQKLHCKKLQINHV